jgi:hypothetical protein
MNASPAVVVVHAIERRVRLRAPALAGERSICQRIAEQLACEPGCEVVTIRPMTGSVIVAACDGKLDPERLRARLAELLGEVRGDDGRPLAAPRPDSYPGPTRVARAVTHAFVGINAEVREAMNGRADLGTILPVVFATAGLVEIGVTGKLPVPAWFNLLWWSLRSFMTFNTGAMLEEQRSAGTELSGRRAPSDGGGPDRVEPAHTEAKNARRTSP